MEPKKLGVVVLNCNGRAYTDACIESCRKQTTRDLFDIIMVDNGSSDDSVGYISGKYGRAVQMISLPENLGGTGGFRTGMQYCIDNGYEYVLLLDNDAYFRDPDAIERMLDYMEKDASIGQLGVKILVEPKPDLIQECGAYTDFTDYEMHLGYRFVPDRDDLPTEVECDYVAACCAMMRTDALRAGGLMNADSFLYWDDADQGYRIRQAGYRVVSLGNVSVLHKGSYGRPTTRSTTQYYFTRNWIEYYARYTPEEKQEEMTRAFLQKVFDRFYSCRLQGRNTFADSYLYALVDFIEGIRGKASEGRVRDCTADLPVLDQVLKGHSSIIIEDTDDYDSWENAILKIRKIRPDIEIHNGSHGCSADEPVFRICSHVKEVRQMPAGRILPVIWLDGYGNVIADEETWESYREYDTMLKFFTDSYFTLFLDRVRIERSKQYA